MDFLRRAIELLVSPPGDLVYHLVTLFAIQFFLSIAVGHWRRHRDDPVAFRMFAAALGVTVTRVLAVLVAAFDRAGLLAASTVLPPLERWLETVTLAWVIWAFVPSLQQVPRLSTALLLVTLFGTFCLYVISALLWLRGSSSRGYVQTGSAVIWELVALGLSVVGLLSTWIVRRSEWGVLTGLFLLWLMGHALQLIDFWLALPPLHPDTAGWVRAGSLVALPLLASLAYRQVLFVSPSVARRPEHGLFEVLQVLRRLERGRDINAGLRALAPLLATLMEADVVAIGLTEGQAGQDVRIVAVHPSAGKSTSRSDLVLPAADHLLLDTALRSSQLQRAYGSRSVGERQQNVLRRLGDDPLLARHEQLSPLGIYQQLGIASTGPLLVQPLVHRGRAWGLLLVGYPFSQRVWTAAEEQLLQTVGALIAVALSNARERSSDEWDGETLVARGREELLVRRVNELESALEQERQRVQELMAKLRLQEPDMAAHAHAAVPEKSQAWRQESASSAETQAQLQAELAEWRKRAAQLEQQKAALESELNSGRLHPDAGMVGQFSSSGVGGFLVADREGRIIAASLSVQKLLGRERDALLGTQLQALFEEPYWPQAIRQLLQEPTERSIVVALQIQRQVVRAEIERIPPVDRSPIALVVFLYPEDSLISYTQAFASLVEELRTPLTSISGYTDLLLNEAAGILGEMQRRFLLRIRANAERIGKLLEDLIHVTALESGELLLAPEPVDLISVLENAIMALSAEFSARELSVQMNVPTELAPVLADRDALYQIILNLLSNACHCSQPGSEICVRATLETIGEPGEGKPDYVMVSVSDTGGGIAPEDLARVFQRVYRADNPPIKGLGETGVGLSIAKALVEAHGGRIWVESHPPVGCTFSFILPLAPSPEGLRRND